jgi:serine/threonine protein kinase
VFGEVYLAVDTSNNQIVAVKQVALTGKNGQ